MDCNIFIKIFRVHFHFELKRLNCFIESLIKIFNAINLLFKNLCFRSGIFFIMMFFKMSIVRIDLDSYILILKKNIIFELDMIFDL